MGYWIVVATVICAVLAVLIAAMSDLPEWQLPRRRQPLTLVHRLGSPPGVALDALTSEWNAAIATVEPPLEELYPGSSSGNRAHGPDRGSDLASAVKRRPNVIVILGAPTLILAGTPAASVAEEIEQVVAELAALGCRSIIQGFETSFSAPEITRSEMNISALARLAESWNAMLVHATAGYGGHVVERPDDLAPAIQEALRRPLALDLSSLGCGEPDATQSVRLSRR
ncbi:MAG TPA: hypothetical protein VGR16_00160 [Thermomicrobiales bacterium]|nr:hypothetical protein [Thermomicrobiales bacterium]